MFVLWKIVHSTLINSTNASQQFWQNAISYFTIDNWMIQREKVGQRHVDWIENLFSEWILFNKQ